MCMSHVKPEQLSYECFTTPLTQVYYKCSVVGRKIVDGAEDLSCIAHMKGHFVHKAIECRIVHCEADRVCGELDAGDCVKCGTSVSMKRLHHSMRQMRNM